VPHKMVSKMLYIMRRPLKTMFSQLFVMHTITLFLQGWSSAVWHVVKNFWCKLQLFLSCLLLHQIYDIYYF